MKSEDIINQAKQSFDKVLHNPEYHKILADHAHREALIQAMDIRPGKNYLDLGTGNGYIAFELAARFPAIQITGLDIADNSIEQNRIIQKEKKLENMIFCSYDGMRLPFKDSLFYGVVSRYVFHHFPDIAASVRELQRIVEPDGFVLVADPITSDGDNENFIDELQRLKPDGHVHYYRLQELESVFGQCGFRKENCFFSTITYPRELTDEYLRLLDKAPAPLLEKYKITVGEKYLSMTVEVMNVLLRRNT